jgi:hypothetical protein
MLHAIVKKNKRTRMWCGPSAIAAVTGKTYDDALLALKAESGRDVVMGVQVIHLQRALARMGHRMTPVCSFIKSERPTLAAWLKGRDAELRASVVIVNVTRHYVTVKGNRIVDNLTGKPVATSKYPKRRVRVKAAWRVD